MLLVSSSEGDRSFIRSSFPTFRLAKRDASHRTTASDGLNAMTTNFLLRANVSQEVLRKYLLGRHDEEGYPSGYVRPTVRLSPETSADLPNRSSIFRQLLELQ